MSHYDGWVGVDLDGTLAVYDHWRGPTHIGAPIPKMLERVKGWLAEGKDVRIFTARVYAPKEPVTDPAVLRRQNEAVAALIAIRAWCEEHIGKVLPITCTKDYGMVVLYDDRCRQVEQNTGRVIGEE